MQDTVNKLEAGVKQVDEHAHGDATSNTGSSMPSKKR
jgi:hypothetical protein